MSLARVQGYKIIVQIIVFLYNIYKQLAIKFFEALFTVPQKIQNTQGKSDKRYASH